MSLSSQRCVFCVICTNFVMQKACSVLSRLRGTSSAVECRRNHSELCVGQSFLALLFCQQPWSLRSPAVEQCHSKEHGASQLLCVRQTHADTLRQPGRENRDNMHTACDLVVRVPAAFGDLQVIDGPTDQPEPAQIVASLNCIRDAQLLGFFEMRTARLGIVVRGCVGGAGSPDAPRGAGTRCSRHAAASDGVRGSRERSCGGAEKYENAAVRSSINAIAQRRRNSVHEGVRV
jgi:hypothetical protein